jgi:ribosomal-protein-alanine N-acetyltransferase
MGELTVNGKTPFVVQRMTLRDIPEVMAVEKASFPSPWSATAYRHELTHNDRSHYIVVRQRGSPRAQPRRGWFDRWLKRPASQLPPVIGYGGFWVLGEEAHISTIAVHPNWRGHGIGELLLVAMLDLAVTLDAQVVTLEVRVSNVVAQNLYRKYQFEAAGRRRRYYRDNGEDALIMTTPCLDDPTLLKTYHQRRTALYERLEKSVARDAQEAADHPR